MSRVLLAFAFGAALQAAAQAQTRAPQSASSRTVLSTVTDNRNRPIVEFGPDDFVVILGQDGLVANTLKYLNGQPVVGVNPDPEPDRPPDAGAGGNTGEQPHFSCAYSGRQPKPCALS